MNVEQLTKKIESDKATNLFKQLYGNKPAKITGQRKRYKALVQNFETSFPDFNDLSLFSTPGRTEVGGNHTDHNAGRVLAASVDLDIIAVCAPTNDDSVVVQSSGYDEIKVNITDLEPKEGEKFTSTALVKGVCARFVQQGHKIGGFRACLNGNVPKAAGLSSSAAFEVLIATILNHFYNQGALDNTNIAQIAQFAENNYFGKPCGLMDQTTCAYGGLVFIDFKDFSNPIIEVVNYDFSNKGLAIMIIETGGDHADLNDDYAALENEMKNVAKHLGGSFLREFTDSKILENLNFLRTKVSDRAVLRAFHFLNDDMRVVRQVEALKNDKIDDFLLLIKESGESSWMLCQNCYSIKNVEQQGISIALATTDQVLKEGAWRLHGGGFAGTIQVFLPNEKVEMYTKLMESIFGENSCHEIFIRPSGTQKVNF